MNQHFQFKIIYSLLAIIFMGSLFFGAYPGRYIVKSLPIFLMAFLCFKYLNGRIRTIMVLGFLFSASGDIFLDLSRTHFFVYGLSSFAIAQVMYTIAFGMDIKRNQLRTILAILVVSYALIFTLILVPHLGNLLIPVVIYVGLITAMGVSAALTNRQLTTVFVGALMFILSDSIIAVSKFMLPHSWGAILIMPTYYLAQYKIGFGMIKDC